MLWTRLSLIVILTGEFPLFAGEVIPTLPLTNNPTYTEAVAKAQDAFCAQTGLSANAKKVVDYETARATQVLSDLGIDKPVGAALWVGKVVRQKDANFPIMHNVRIDVQPSQVSTTIKLEF